MRRRNFLFAPCLAQQFEFLEMPFKNDTLGVFAILLNPPPTRKILLNELTQPLFLFCHVMRQCFIAGLESECQRGF